ncbi:MAG: chaB, partial [Modestobacter sp.]|nr:chaB [Modestobacter sp.]
KAHDAAADEYGDEQRANRVAWAAVKHTHEKVGDHWEPKDHKGPSDPQAEGGADTDRETKGGVDANATKDHLMDVARELDVSGRSSMTKDELVEAIQKANDKATADARRPQS